MKLLKYQVDKIIEQQMELSGRDKHRIQSAVIDTVAGLADSNQFGVRVKGYATKEGKLFRGLEVSFILSEAELEPEQRGALIKYLEEEGFEIVTVKVRVYDNRIDKEVVKLSKEG